jgi:hypothetical protein
MAITIQKGLKMVNEDTSVALGEFSTPKQQYIEGRRAHIFKMKKEIEQLEQDKKTLQPGSFEFLQCEKNIARRYAIIKDCEQSIYLTKVQMNVQTHPRFRGL